MRARDAWRAAVASVAFLTRIPLGSACCSDRTTWPAAPRSSPAVGAGLGALVGALAAGLDARFTALAAALAVALEALLTGRSISTGSRTRPTASARRRASVH